MIYTGTKIIKTKRLVLRPFEIDDINDMFNNWANNENVTKYLSWKAHKTPKETKEIIELWCSEYKNPKYFNWCITIDNKPIGSIGIVGTSEEESLAEIGFCIGEQYWNQGITTEALCAIRDYLINKVQYKVLIGAHHILNTTSGKVFTKSGFNRDETMDNFEKYMQFNFKVIAYSYYSS